MRERAGEGERCEKEERDNYIESNRIGYDINYNAW